MNNRHRKSKQGELFPSEHPPHLITDKRREVLIPLLSMIIAVAMEAPNPAPDSRTTPGAGHDG